MDSFKCHSVSTKLQGCMMRSCRSLRPRNVSHRVQTISRPQPFYLGHFHRNSSSDRSLRCQAATQDPDDYEETDIGYDSDDYELLEASAVAPRTAEHFSATASSAASSSSSSTGEKKRSLLNRSRNIRTRNSNSSTTSTPVGAGGRENGRHSTRQAIKTGFNIFLLFGATIDRLVSRAQAAGMAASITLLSLTRRHAKTAKLEAQKSFHSSPAGRKMKRWAQSVNELKQELPEDTWGKILWLWDRPPVQRIRFTVSMANLSFRLPALLALVATQVGLLASQVSLPMLAPLLLGTGMLFRSIQSNASFLLPRIGVLVVMLWMLWFINSVVHNTTAYLRKQNALDNRLAGGIITVSECSTLLIAMVVLLSMLGVNVSALLLPAGVAVAVAAKDLAHNFLAGLFLFVVQPFKLGDRLSVASSTQGGMGPTGGWFEGVCEKVDLRYVIVRQGRRKLMIPNSAFITREFMVMDDTPVGEFSSPPPQQQVNNNAGSPSTVMHPQQYMTNDYRHVWQYVEGPPVHQELQNAYRYPPPPPPPQQQQQSAPAAPVNGLNGSAPTNDMRNNINVRSNGNGSMSSSPSSSPSPSHDQHEDEFHSPPSAVNGNGNSNGNNGNMNGAAAAPSQSVNGFYGIDSSGAPLPPPPPPFNGNTVPMNGTTTTTIPINGNSQQQQPQYYTYNGMMSQFNHNQQHLSNAYWQQQQQPYSSMGPWSHPLSHEGWQQEDQQIE